MNIEAAHERARTIAQETLAPAASRHDKEGSFPTEAVAKLGASGLLALSLPESAGGAGLGPRAFAEVAATLAEADASVAMIYMMHVCGTNTIAAGARGERARSVLADIAKGTHLTTLAFSEKGSRSHFWAPVSRASKHGDHVHLNAQKSWVTSAGEADSYVVTTLAADGKTSTDTTLYLVDPKSAGVKIEIVVQNDMIDANRLNVFYKEVRSASKPFSAGMICQPFAFVTRISVSSCSGELRRSRAAFRKSLFCCILSPGRCARAC